MSSPRKYSSPYLSSLPGLVGTVTPKTKKRSKSSLSNNKGAPTSNTAGQGESDPVKNDTLTNNNSFKGEGSYDLSSGDVDQSSLDDIKNASSAAKPLDIALSDNEEEPIATQHGSDSNANLESNATEDTPIYDANISESALQTELETISSFVGAEACEEPSSSGTPTEAASSPSLKSILKVSTAYQSKSRIKDRKVVKSKTKTGKIDSKEGKERDGSMRTLTSKSIASGGGSASTTAGVSKLEIFQQKYSRNTKSPRNKGKQSVPALAAKSDEKVTLPLMPRKSVRFSTRIDIYHVPYESRAGSRACDWQRNMLEQRVQNFRQLMKEVGSEDIDLYAGGANGLIFPGYPPYHLPNPNFSLRGRVRNFKF